MERLLKEALGLSEGERAELARDLVKSLDGPADMTAANDWDQEIVRRIEQIDAGTAKTTDRNEFSRRLKERPGIDAASSHSEAAAQEALEAAAWYEREQGGLGVEFEAAIQAALDVLEAEIVPLSIVPGAAGGRGAKRLMLRRFPFDVVVVEGRTRSWPWHLRTKRDARVTGEAACAPKTPALSRRTPALSARRRRTLSTRACGAPRQTLTGRLERDVRPHH